MADFSFTPAAAGIRPIPQTSLSDMLNVARGAQQYQQAQQINPLELQRAQTELQRIQALTPLEIERAGAETRVATGTEKPRIESATSAAETAKVGTQSATLKFLAEQQGKIASRMTSIINNPLVIAAERDPNIANANKEQLGRIISEYGKDQAKELGISEDKAQQLIAPYLTAATQTPGGLRQYMKEKLLSSLEDSARASTLQPSGLGVSTGAGGATVATSEFGQYPQGTALPGTTYTSQLPPTTTVVNPETGQIEYLGPQPPNVSATGQPAPRVIAGVGAPQAGILGATATVVGNDWTQTVQDAQSAQGRIGLFQDIKKYAPEAFTGVGGERKALAAGIARLIGIDAFTAEQTATEQLQKNAALLSLVGGNTDAARSLAEAANPNKKLNQETIQNIADQLIGVEKMKLAKQQFLQPFVNNAQNYQTKKLEFDRIADPRLFQEMTPQSVAKLKASMSPAAIKELTEKIQAARQLGIIQ